ncbi:MAG: ABC transporter permease [Gemmatimonadales bacterium]
MTAPAWVAALIRLVAPAGRAEDAIGDLVEMHARRRARGRVRAQLMLLAGAADLAVALYRERRRVERRRWRVRRMIDGWFRDLRLAARALRRAPSFTAVTTLTLALAIGANTAIFSVVDTVLIDPLGFPAAERLVSIGGSAPGTDMPPEFRLGAEFLVEYQEADRLESLAMYGGGQTTVRAEDRVERLFVATALPSLYPTLGAEPALGRLPNDEDDSGAVMLISHWLWSSWFGSDPAIVGRSFEVSGRSRTVVGVMPASWRFPEARIAIWLHATIRDPEQLRPGSFAFALVGRMTPGTTTEELASELDVLAQRLPERFGGPASYRDIIAKHRAVVTTLEEATVGEVARPLWLLLGTVGIVLLIACANVANLFTVRGEGRRRDLAVRLALGSGRAGLIRAQMAEALLLAGLGGAMGAFLAWLTLPLLVRIAPENIPNLDLASLDGRALAFALGVTLVTAAVFGLAPAFRFSRPRFVGALRQAGAIGEEGRRYGRDLLVFVQTAMALLLLVGSGLLLRSFWTLSHVDPGYDTRDVFTFQVAPSREGLRDGPSYAAFHRQFMEQVATLPGVESVGLTNWLPLDEGAASNRFATEESIASGQTLPPAEFTFVGGDYFGTMGISLLRGRLLEPSDDVVGPTNVVISTTAAARFWPGQNPLGKRISMTAGDTTGWLTVVGEVEDVLADDFRQAAPSPMVYLPMVGPNPRWAVGSPAYVVKTPRGGEIEPDVRELMRRHVPESPMYRIFTMEGLAERSMAQLSFTMLMLAIASGLALALGAVGLYGVLSYVVSNRKQEIAIRMALGAEATRVRRMVVAHGARITMAGVAVGLVAAFFLTRLLDSLLYGVGALDPVTFVAMSLVMIAVALLASYLPARRASAVDPMASLRAE